MSPATDTTSAVRVRGLRVRFDGAAGEVVRGVDLDLLPGQVTALVGESGSGKSLTSLAVMGLLPRGASVTGGTVELDGVDVTHLDERAWQDLRGTKVAMVFQDPMAALNPSFTVGWQIAETFRRHAGADRSTARARTVELMGLVGIADPEARYGAYPHQFSGGMRQRAVIAMALALEPDVLLADEPTTALDVTVQAQILRLLTERQEARAMAVLLVSHDLGVVAQMAQRVQVMYAGRIVEAGPLDAVYTGPAHPYTLGLLQALPDPTRAGRLRPIEGQPPPPGHRPVGCAFVDRCRFATEVCHTDDPALGEVADSPAHAAACHHTERVRDVTGSRR